MTDRKDKFISRLSPSATAQNKTADSDHDGSPASDQPTSYQTGKDGESRAVAYLRLRGYGILEQRYKTAVGEIDIIAKKGRTLIFVEVKSHKTEASSLESVTEKQQRRIVKAAQWYLSSHPQFSEFDQRFDVMAVAPKETAGGLGFLKSLFCWRRVHHLKNAFEAH